MSNIDKEKYTGDVESKASSHHIEFYDPSKESIWTRLGLSLESFKRAPGTTGGQVVSGDLTPEEIEKLRAEAPMLQAKMKPRHLNMIAAEVLVPVSSSVRALLCEVGAIIPFIHVGGPAGVLIAWIIIGIMMISVTQALGEMSILYPLSGGFYTLANRFLDPGFAFAMGWNYYFQWACTLPLEITVAGTTVSYWTGDSVPIAAWITVFWSALIILCVFGTLGYAEEEFWASLLKLIVVIIFVIIGVVCVCGGGPSDGLYNHYIGARNFYDPGGFANGFPGLCAVFVTAAFAFTGTEVVGIAASETPNPRATMPAAVKGTFWRVTVIYITSLLLVGLLVPYTDDRLLGGSGAAASPFVIALDNAKIHGFNHVVNATICVSVMSIGLSCVYAGSRTLTALAETGYAPKIFTYVDKSSRPLFSMILTILFVPIAYVNVRAAGDEVFDWLLAISGLATLFTWGSILLCHIRFRRAWKVQGHSVEELPFQALGGIYGSIVGVILIVLVFIAQFYVAIWPVGSAGLSGRERAESFFKSFLAGPIILVNWTAGYAWKRTRPLRAHEIDLDTGRKTWYTAEQMREYRAERARAPFYIRIFRLFFTN
ncbi:amino-acid permease inda1 [Moniliophthora roreri]|nr:amino-acid permease inda1 [Moniliophthora roreri]